jgi:hypothetical protein
MPLILAQANKVVEERAVKIRPPAGIKFWGKPEGDIRYICGTSDYAIYVIEEEPGKRSIKWMYERTTTLWFPWIYFFVKVPRGLKTSLCSPAYILISRRRQETLEERTLMIPYLPNLFKHGGICPNHQVPLKAMSPAVLARSFVTWYWMSKGSRVFDGTVLPPSNMKRSAHTATDISIIRSWSRSTPEKVLKIDFQKARFRSVKEAAHRLQFAYYKPNFGPIIDDMIYKPSVLKRVEIN